MAAPEPKRAKSEISSLLTTVSDALAKQADKSLFAVGGRINVDKLVSVGSNVSEKSPIVLRWDSGELNHCHKASLPVLANDSASGEAFAKLLEDSEPATYGVGNKEVLDETYRKAGKMNAARFSTNLNPYEHGVIDAIAQALAHGQHRGIRAELYNLNVGRAG
jgi:ATP phosphoribosyltransferase regulatory subunit HisZ